MNLYNLFSRPLYVNYYGRFFSEATIFYIIITLIRFILPLVIVWRSDSFWLKESTFREMPDVDFKKNFILLLDTININENHTIKTCGFSTFSHINQAFRDGHMWIAVNIEQYEIDYNDDNKYDELNLNMEIPIDLYYEQVFGLRIIIFFWYRLYERIHLQMESLVDVSHNSLKPGQSLRIVGDLDFIQKVPFQHRGYEFRYNYSMIPEIDENNTIDYDENPFFLEDMLQQYVNRNYYTRILPSYQNWQPYKPMANKKMGSFQLDLTIYYRNQLFQYMTGFWYLIKWALVQYLAIFIIFDYFINLIKSYVFDGYLVITMAQLSDQELIRCMVTKKQF